MFDEVTVAVLENPDKKPLLSFNERKALIQQVFHDRPEIKVAVFNGLLVDFATKTGVNTIVRGLRAVSDFDYEFQIALTNRKINTSIDTVFLMTAEKYSFLSSNIVRQLVKFDADVSTFVPSVVYQKLKEKFK